MDVTSRKHQFAINAASGWVAQATFAAVGLVLMPYAIWRLGSESYGVFLLARSAIIFFMLMQLGMGQSLIRFCSQALARKDMDKIASISSTSQIVTAGLGLLAAGIGFVMIPFFISFYEIPPGLIWDAQAMLICMSISIVLHMSSLVPQGLLSGANRYDMTNGTEIVVNLFRLVLVIAFFELISPSIALFGLAFLIATLVRFVALYWMSVKAIGRKAFFSFHHVDFSDNRDILKFSFLPFTQTIAMAAIFQSPILIIGKILGEEAVTFFAPAMLISQVLNSFLRQTSLPLVPLASRDKEENGSRNFGRWAIQFGQITAIFGFGVTLIFCLFGSELLSWWLGSKFSGVWLLVTLMVAGITMMQIQASTGAMALGASDFRPFVFCDILMAVSMVIGTMLCLHHGGSLLSVALLFFTCSIVRNIFILPWFYSKAFQYSIKSYMRQIYIKPLAIFAMVFCFGWIVKELGPNTILAEVTALACVTLILGIVIWVTLMPVEIKRYIKSII